MVTTDKLKPPLDSTYVITWQTKQTSNSILTNNCCEKVHYVDRIHGSIKLDLPCCCSSRIFRMAARIIFLSSYSLAARSFTEKSVSTRPVSSGNTFHAFFPLLIPFWWAHRRPVPTAVFLPGCPTSQQILTWKRQWRRHGRCHVLARI